MLVREIKTVQCDSAVGLFVHEGRLVLQVPFGMEQMEPARALALLYMGFVVFRRTRRAVERLGAIDGVERQSAQGLEAAPRGASFCDAWALDELFDRVDPRSVLSFCERPGWQSRNVHRRIDKHLHLALFDEDGVAYLDRVPGHRRAMQYGSADIVALYCFVALDFYQNFLRVEPSVGWGSFAPEGVALANDFQQRHLTLEDSLYLGDEYQRERCRDQLRHLLHVIGRAAPVRDARYQQFHDALYRYLHAGTTASMQDGQIWGIRDFWAVWESACLCHAVAAQPGPDHSAILTCDFEHLPQGLSSQALEESWLDWRRTVFARNGISRRPDLVLDGGDVRTVVDFKYYREPTLARPKPSAEERPTKIDNDFLSMEVYGLLLKNDLLASSDQRSLNVKLEMWLPGAQPSTHAVEQLPRWDPPLSIRQLPTAAVMARYGALYGAGGASQAPVEATAPA